MTTRRNSSSQAFLTSPPDRDLQGFVGTIGKGARHLAIRSHLVGGTLTPEELLRRLQHRGGDSSAYGEAGDQLCRHRAYRKVGNNLRASGHEDLEEPSREAILQIAGGIQELNRDWGLKIASCAEEVDLSVFGIAHNRCIDDDLMARVFPDDTRLMDFLGRGVGASKGLFAASPSDPHPLKDKGQREACGCIVSKDIGRYNTCPHFCIYCYANVSQSLVRAMRERHSPMRRSLRPEKRRIPTSRCSLRPAASVTISSPCWARGLDSRALPPTRTRGLNAPKESCHLAWISAIHSFRRQCASGSAMEKQRPASFAEEAAAGPHGHPFIDGRAIPPLKGRCLWRSF